MKSILQSPHYGLTGMVAMETGTGGFAFGRKQLVVYKLHSNRNFKIRFVVVVVVGCGFFFFFHHINV